MYAVIGQSNSLVLDLQHSIENRSKSGNTFSNIETVLQMKMRFIIFIIFLLSLIYYKWSPIFLSGSKAS